MSWIGDGRQAAGTVKLGNRTPGTVEERPQRLMRAMLPKPRVMQSTGLVRLSPCSLRRMAIRPPHHWHSVNLLCHSPLATLLLVMVRHERLTPICRPYMSPAPQPRTIARRFNRSQQWWA